MPSAMLKLSGIARIVCTTGAAIREVLMSISTIDCIMNTPTMTRAAPSPRRTTQISGVKKQPSNISTDVVIGVSPCGAGLDA